MRANSERADIISLQHQLFQLRLKVKMMINVVVNVELVKNIFFKNANSRPKIKEDKQEKTLNRLQILCNLG